MDCEIFYIFSARYPPHSDSIVPRSRHQILSVRRKYYASDLVALEGFYKFFARKPPYSDNPVLKSSHQILSVWLKYYAVDPTWVVVRVLIRSPLDTLHTLIVLSLDPDTKYSPSGENTRVLTG